MTTHYGKAIRDVPWSNPWCRKWAGLIDRSLSNRRASYASSQVCDEWLYASEFCRWAGSFGVPTTYHADKDLLQQKVYSPESCLLVPIWLNSRVKRHTLGVHFNNQREKWIARLTQGSTRKFLGQFDTKEQALSVFSKAKREYYLQLASDRSEDLQHDARIVPALKDWLKQYEV